jgi:carboxylesterase type B
VQGEPAWYALLPAEITGNGAQSIPTSEDCLTLDVFAPSDATNMSLPVLIWIHGGGYTFGNGRHAGGPNFITHSGDSMLFVSIQYRLGAYGFLAGDDVAKEGTPNAALLDQRMAIDWVQRHISAFGGNPGKVCAIAQSDMNFGHC